MTQDSTPESLSESYPSISSTNQSKLITGSLDKLRSDFLTNVSSQTSQIISNFITQYAESISESSISMLPAYNFEVKAIKSGNFLSLDLGGSTLRIAIVKLNSRNQKADILKSVSYDILDESKHLNVEFFDWIALKIKEIICSIQFFQSPLVAGLTWSFPIIQTAVNDGYINTCGKGYTADPFVMNKSIKKLLEFSCEKIGLNIKLCCLVNDTVGVYLSSKFLHSSTSMGLVLGTGTNCCLSFPTNYVKSTKKLKENSTILKDHKECLFNTELSFFGDFLKIYMTKYDYEVYDWDKIVHANIQNLNFNPFQPLEFLTSGRYIGELVRLIMVDYHSQGTLFKDEKLNERILKPYDEFTGEICCNLHNEPGSISNFFLKNYDMSCTETDSNIIHTIITNVVDRASIILSCSIIALESFRMEKSSKLCDIGFGGSVLKYFKYYRERVEKDLKKHDPEVKHSLKFIENSSILGSVIGASINS